MKNKRLLLIGFLLSISLHAQSDLNCESILKGYYDSYQKDSDILTVKEKELATLLSEITLKTTVEDDELEAFKEKKNIIFTLKENLDSIVNGYINFKNICVINNGITEKKAMEIWDVSKVTLYNLEKETIKEPVVEEPVVYTYLSDDTIIANDILGDKAETPQGKSFTKVLEKVNEKSYLGDITIPKDNQEFKFYKYNKDNKKIEQIDNLEYKYKFKKIKIEIKDGVFADIQILVEHKGKLLWFENRKGVSILRYSDYAKHNYMFFSQKITDITNENEYEKLRIRLSDVMSYKYKIGNNYIPTDLTLELPKVDINNVSTNVKAPAIYQIKEEVSLDKMLEFRTYTDLLTLFGGEENGLVQLEGKAKFYINLLYQKKSNKTQIIWAKSVSPYVNYSRLEEDDRFVNASSNIDGLDIINSPLDLIEKKFLTMASEIEILDVFRKKGLFKFGLYADFNYNISKVKSDNENAVAENLKFFGYGGGLKLDFKRFNNFGFNYKLGLMYYDFKNYNTSNTVDTNINIPVLSHNAEIFYKMPGTNGQTIYARLVTYNYSGGDSNEAFYQLQFGYKFSIGSRVVSK